VPAPLADTALPSLVPASAALRQRSESGQQRSNRPTGDRLSRGRAASFWAVAGQDDVDRIVPPHYSAAPSGDLCTTLRLSFVVRGESKENVPTTGDKPQRLPAGLASVLAEQLILGWCNSTRRKSTQPKSVRDSEQNVVSRYGSEGNISLSVEYNRTADVAATIGRVATVLVSVNEQMKHDPCNAQTRRALSQQARSKRVGIHAQSVKVDRASRQFAVTEGAH
jgi:hypothetical protein